MKMDQAHQQSHIIHANLWLTNNGEELPMNPAMSLYVTVKDPMEMERLFSGSKKRAPF